MRGQTRQTQDPVRIEPSVRYPVPLLGRHKQKISRSVKDAMDQDGVALHFVKNQIVVDDKNAIAKRSERGSLRNTTNIRIRCEGLLPRLDMVVHISGGLWIFCGQIGHQFHQILLGNREQADGVLI
ncbi:MAG: hypothetical protein ABIU05_16000 [Nitrospirales bacterium]